MFAQRGRKGRHDQTASTAAKLHGDVPLDEKKAIVARLRNSLFPRSAAVLRNKNKKKRCRQTARTAVKQLGDNAFRRSEAVTRSIQSSQVYDNVWRYATPAICDPMYTTRIMCATVWHPSWTSLCHCVLRHLFYCAHWQCFVAWRCTACCNVMSSYPTMIYTPPPINVYSVYLK